MKIIDSVTGDDNAVFKSQEDTSLPRTREEFQESLRVRLRNPSSLAKTLLTL